MRLPTGSLSILLLAPPVVLLGLLQARWLESLEGAQAEELRYSLQRGAERIARELEAAVEAGRLSFEEDRPELDPAVVDALVEAALGPAAAARTAVAIESVHGGDSPLPPIYGEPRDDPAEGVATFSHQAQRWVGFFPLASGESGESGELLELRGSELPVVGLQGGERRADEPSAAAPDESATIDLGPGPPRWEVVLRHRDGPLAAVVARGRARNRLLGGASLALLALVATALVVAQRRARRLAERELAFVAGVSHDLRTPLAVIQSAASNLERGIVSGAEAVREYGSLIGRESERMAARVERALLSSSARGPAARESIDVRRWIEEAVEACRHRFDRGGFALRLDVPPELPSLHGDRVALGSALENLIDNALKYGPPDQTVRVRARVERGTLVVEVEDEGPGIPRAERGIVFEPFRRGRRAREGAAGGSGLGLALVRRVAREHGGEAELGEGSRGALLRLRLPLERA